MDYDKREKGIGDLISGMQDARYIIHGLCIVDEMRKRIDESGGSVWWKCSYGF